MNIRHLRHTPTCASGARAETRGKCNCGAKQQDPAWSVRVLDAMDAAGHPMVELKAREELTSGEAVMLSIALQEATRECGRRFAQAVDRAHRRAARTTVVATKPAGDDDAADELPGLETADEVLGQGDPGTE